MTIDDILTDLLRREGWPAYTDRASDKGGPTKGGVTLRTLSAWRSRPCTIADLQALPEAEARAIYRRRYVEDPRFDRIADERLRALLVDAGVLSGPTTAIGWLQEACGTTIDGVLGPDTLAAIVARGPETVYRDVLRLRTRALVRLGTVLDPAFVAFLREHPGSQAANLSGWVNRCLEFV